MLGVKSPRVRLGVGEGVAEGASVAVAVTLGGGEGDGEGVRLGISVAVGRQVREATAVAVRHPAPHGTSRQAKGRYTAPELPGAGSWPGAAGARGEEVARAKAKLLTSTARSSG